MDIQNFPELYTSPTSGECLEKNFIFVRFLQKAICFSESEQKS